MLQRLTAQEAQSIANLAQAARVQRDRLLGNVAEEALDDVQPARGEHNPAAALGFEPLSADSPQVSALRAAVAAVSPPARAELYALMRIGQGHLGAKDLERGAAEASVLGDETISAALLEDSDLHDHLTKALYEAGYAA